MQVVTFQRQRERQAEELLLTPGEMAARCDWQQVRRMREEMPDDVCSTHAWYQNCDALDRELRAQYPMIGALETAVRAYGYAMENSTRPRVQETMRWLKARFGKNILLRATSLEDGATAMQRNAQIGGHKA